MTISRFTSLFILFSLIFSTPILSQSADADYIKGAVSQSDVEFNIYFLAADEFLGRDTGTQELKIASRYIATWFQTNGIKTAPGYDTYFQEVPFQRLREPDRGVVAFGDSTFTLNRDFVPMNSERGSFNAPFIVLEYGSREELSEQDVEGKIVITAAGLQGQTSPQQFFFTAGQKQKWLKEAGAVALIELYSNRQ
jgi:hypothetical protein